MGVGSCLVALSGCLFAANTLSIAAAQGSRALSDALSQGSRTLSITWDDLGPLQAALRARGIDAGGFDAYVERTREANVRRVREGDLDALVFYLLQSRRITDLPAIEPALSAKALVEGLPAAERTAFLQSGAIDTSQVSPAVRARMAAFLDTAGLSPDNSQAGPLRGTRPTGAPDAGDDARLAYFRELVTTAFPDAAAREAALLGEYLRAMQFLYRQEFVAQRSADAPAAVRELYQRRGFSTDTAVEAGFLVHSGLGIVQALEPERRIRRVLIVGPGMDLAPRTALVESPAESYQPWAVVDALLALGLASQDALEVVAADINPRVVAHLARARASPPALALVTEIAETAIVTLSDDFREYFSRLGDAIADGVPPGMREAGPGYLTRRVTVRPDVARTLRAEQLDIVTGRLDEPPFDLVIATNILPYFDDTELMLAMTNIARMLAPGGRFLHNEPRPILGEITEALGMSFDQSRHAIIAHVRGAPPLGDSVWVHRRAR